MGVTEDKLLRFLRFNGEGPRKDGVEVDVAVQEDVLPLGFRKSGSTEGVEKVADGGLGIL